MVSRKEEERNEKIIRGLMKLPPNRRCVNCNSLGPQYVCTNFWTFVCMTCSGIHREFTHRVKSISMSKFTSQEVEALQNGGNQRARDIYLKDWDLQRQRLPDSSNADKIREFIKNVYLGRKYAGGKTSDQSPSDIQSLRNHEDEIRRASSYHSYSQSPPYDYQYEDRRYGKQVAAALSRKPGSDRGHYVGVSDYSVSSGGDPFKSGTGSPNFLKDTGFGSPTAQAPRDVSSEDTRCQTINLFVDPSSKKDAGGIPRPERTKSMGSFGSFDSNSMSVKSCNSSIGLDVVSAPEQTAGSYHDKACTFAQSSVPVNYGGLDLFNAPEAFVPPPIDLFQLPATSSVSSEDIFQPAAVSSIPSGNVYQPPPSTPSIDLFAGIAKQPSAASFDGKSPELPVPKHEGWATFDTPQHAASGPVTKNLSPAVMPSDGDLSVKFDQLSSLNTTMQWPLFENSSALGATSAISSQWKGGLHDDQASTAATSTQSWNAFNDSAESLSLEPQVVAYNLSPAVMPSDGDLSVKFDQLSSLNTTMQWPLFENFSALRATSAISSQRKEGLHDGQASTAATSTQSWNAFNDSAESLSLEPQVVAYNHLATTDQHLGLGVSENLDGDGIQTAASHAGFPASTLPSEDGIAPSYSPSLNPLLIGGKQLQAADHESINPFDLPFDSELEQSDMFLDMSSLQTALPNAQLPSTFLDGVSQPWFPQNPLTPYIPATPQGGLAYISGQAPTSQLSNVPSQGPVASIGGNPFA